MHKSIRLTILAAASISLYAQSTLPLMPLPKEVTAQSGFVAITSGFSVTVSGPGADDARVRNAIPRLLARLTRQTGIPIPLMAPVAENDAALLITVAEAGHSGPQRLGDNERYSLTVDGKQIKLAADTPLGVLRGMETLLQLVQQTPTSASATPGFSVPNVVIHDEPRFPWRGLSFDVSRHFMPIAVVKRTLDGLAAVKLNVLHWHLSDDEGIRVESKTFPKLQELGSDGLYYTQDEIRDVIAYAADRGIRVVPEFDMPAHSTSWFVGYPDLASGKGPFQIERHWGVFDPAMDPTRESTYQFLNLFIGEMTALFPDRYFHIGGDECNGKEWDENPRVQEYMRAHKIKDNAALQAMFTARVQKLVAARHKVMEGWDEVLQPNTPKDVVIQSWRGRDSLLDAAKRGYRALLSNGYYIDLNKTAEEHYLVDPLEGIADKLTPEQTASILGGEATMWSEFVNGEIVESRIWPRTAAIAERFWSPQQVRDVDSMYARLAVIAQKLQFWGIENQATSEQMLERMTGDANPALLRVLASVVSPPKGYDRGDMRDYTSQTPLNHLVDAISPESETARSFREICKRIVTGTATPDEWRQAQEMLLLWRDNDAQLQILLARSSLTEELMPISQSLYQVSQIGLKYLELRRQGGATTVDAQQKDLAALAVAEKPQAVLLLMVAPPIELLVKSAKLQ